MIFYRRCHYAWEDWHVSTPENTPVNNDPTEAGEPEVEVVMPGDGSDDAPAPPGHNEDTETATLGDVEDGDDSDDPLDDEDGREDADPADPDGTEVVENA